MLTAACALQIQLKSCNGVQAARIVFLTKVETFRVDKNLVSNYNPLHCLPDLPKTQLDKPHKYNGYKEVWVRVWVFVMSDSPLTPHCL